LVCIFWLLCSCRTWYASAAICVLSVTCFFVTRGSHLVWKRFYLNISQPGRSRARISSFSGLLRFFIKSLLRTALPAHFRAWALQGQISSFRGLVRFPIKSLLRTLLPAHFRDWAHQGEISSFGGLVRFTRYQILTQKRSPGSFPGLGAPGPDLLIPGPGQIPFQALTQSVSPGSFRGLDAPGRDFLIAGLGLIPHQILTQNSSPGSFSRLGAPGPGFFNPGLGQIPYQIVTQNLTALPAHSQAWAPQGQISSFWGLGSFSSKSLLGAALPPHFRAWTLQGQSSSSRPWPAFHTSPHSQGWLSHLSSHLLE
jgi:hypothetical protein